MGEQIRAGLASLFYKKLRQGDRMDWRENLSPGRVRFPIGAASESGVGYNG